MQIDKTSSFPLEVLKGALITNEHGSEFRIIDFYVHIEKVTDVMISVRPYDDYGNLEPETCGLQLSNLKGWSIQLQGGYYND
jgi:hypothetical protein